MRPLPRFAVGTIQSDARREPMLWGLLAALHELDITPALFRSSCRLTGGDAAKAVTGCPARHLDSWAMSRFGAKQTLVRSVAASELAIVEGEFGHAAAYAAALPAGAPPASSLDTLCEWLELPRIGIVDVRGLAPCHLPLFHTTAGNAPLDGLLLDRVGDARDIAYWRTQLEAQYGAPVLGYLDEVPKLRALCASLPSCSGPSTELCTALGRRLLRSLDVERLLALACRPQPIDAAPEPYLTAECPKKFRIAIAYDDAYCGYYPETLDLLEAAGAELCDFSPLKSETLPKGADIVYVGCGHPERYAEQLAANHCLKQSLRTFAAGGGRIYAQGAGLAYLCRDVVFPCGKSAPMTGLLPATARWLPGSPEFEPAEIVFGASCWMMPARTSLRGYRHTNWQIEPRGPMLTYALDARQRLDILGRGNVIGSRVLINLAANRHLLARFFQPYAPALSAARGW